MKWATGDTMQPSVFTVCVCILGILSYAQSIPTSPCPDGLTYETTTDPDRIYGNIKVTVQRPLKGIRLTIVLDKKAQLLGNYFADSTTTDNIEYNIIDLNYEVKANAALKFRFFLKYAAGTESPSVKAIYLNGQQICPTNGPFTPTVIEPQEGPGAEVKCGVAIKMAVPRLDTRIGVGEYATEGEFPWQVAIYKSIFEQSDGSRLVYICGGSLISSKAILTAAHCVTHKSSVFSDDPSSFQVHMGLIHLGSYQHVDIRTVSKIIVHEDYNTDNYKSDVAILKLDTPVKFSEYVIPICLWDKKEPAFASADLRFGTVPGWGQEGSGKHSNILRKAVMRKIACEVPIENSLYDYYNRLNQTVNFCALFGTGTVCRGDSGSGVIFKVPFTSGTAWALKGVVSHSPDQDCDERNPVVFTDLLHYLPWIEQSMTVE